MTTQCINVFKGLRFSTGGEVSFCCKSEMLLDDKDGNKCRIYTHDFNEPLNGKLATEIRTDLENGIKHANCKQCWDEESAGIPSKRILDNKNWGPKYLNDKTVEPAIVELNLGTLCNLKCRICGPWCSSRWVEEFFTIKTQGNDPGPDAKEKYMLMVKDWQGNYEDDSPAWDHIEKSLPHLKQIDIYGGEPFLVEKQWEILKRSIEIGYSKNQILHFNTNATQFNPSHIELLKHFKKVLISLSIDGIGKRFEYQRHPAKWSLVENNIRKFLSLQNNNNNIHVSACLTVSTLNVYYLEETLKHFAQIGESYGPFDLALIECGQYNTMWPDIHMFPEESAQAGLDLKAKAIMPIHWGAFKLSSHAWTAPILQIRKKARTLGVPIVSPKIGAPIRIDKLPEPSSVWWATAPK